MFGEKYSASELVSKGDVVSVSGTTVEEVFNSVCRQVKLPSGVTPEVLVKELMDRENVLSTAVGNGISIPHPRRPLVSNSDESCVIVAYLKTPINMNAPDTKRVSAMFILLSASSQVHIKSLSSFAAIFRMEAFKKAFQLKLGKADLVKLLQKCEALS
ncbi:MAG: PTS sugar transporter subunit IIA [Spirochaetales bacterium]|nr:PTS sugar transporter subunit IIA [Spirochaetales bacterium]